MRITKELTPTWLFWPAPSTPILLAACGLLKRQRLGDLGKAWTYYRSAKPHSPAEFVRQSGSNSHTDVEVKFLGVWDTVGALGVPGALFSTANQDHYGFHDTGPSPVIRHGCQALAVDEHRSEFVPTLWTGEPIEGTLIEQTWFAGVHSDVGGGYVTRRLADIPLVWMAQKAEADGLALDWTGLPDPAALQPLAPLHDSSAGVFLKDKVLPTFRMVCGRQFPVAFYERLYAPIADGKQLPTIGEAVHLSVIERYGQEAQICMVDKTGQVTIVPYKPRNVVLPNEGTTKLLSNSGLKSY